MGVSGSEVEDDVKRAPLPPFEAAIPWDRPRVRRQELLLRAELPGRLV
jgi:hypothetical protein